jgi:dihydroorotate dehydrogenase (fumarate)
MANPSLSTTLASIPLSSCVFNASGPRTGSGAALSKIRQSSAGAILAKSATVSQQKGNDLPRTWHHDNHPDDKDGFESHCSLNSEGLPNSGIDYYLSKEIIDEAVGDSNKPYLV